MTSRDNLYSFHSTKPAATICSLSKESQTAALPILQKITSQTAATYTSPIRHNGLLILFLISSCLLYRYGVTSRSRFLSNRLFRSIFSRYVMFVSPPMDICTLLTFDNSTRELVME